MTPRTSRLVGTLLLGLGFVLAAAAFVVPAARLAAARSFPPLAIICLMAGAVLRRRAASHGS